MENEDTKKKGIDDSTPKCRHKAGLKFQPKILPKKAPKTIPKVEPHEESKAVTIDNKMMTAVGRFKNTDHPRNGAKAEKQGIPLEVAFGQADPSIPRTFSTPKSFSSSISAVELPKEYVEPWDYTSTSYPVTLPLRRPNSRDPESLDEEEFRHSSSRTQDGELTASELGLMERVDTPQLLFFQFPTSLPLPRQANPFAETETETETDTDEDVNAISMGANRKRRIVSIHGCGLKELPGGHMGKIRVYKSGNVKLTLGDVPFDVSAGSNCKFAQEAVAMDTREKLFCGLGELGKRAILTPDIDYLLGSIEKM